MGALGTMDETAPLRLKFHVISLTTCFLLALHYPVAPIWFTFLNRIWLFIAYSCLSSFSVSQSFSAPLVSLFFSDVKGQSQFIMRCISKRRGPLRIRFVLSVGPTICLSVYSPLFSLCMLFILFLFLFLFIQKSRNSLVTWKQSFLVSSSLCVREILGN